MLIHSSARRAAARPARRDPHRLLRLALLLAALLDTEVAAACACGCGVFDVGTGALFPEGAGSMAYAEYDSMNQNTNWSGTARAPANHNPDQAIGTDFFTLGDQTMFNRAWGLQLDLPVWNRSFTTTDPAGEIATFRHGALGDLRLRGLYTGFSDDLSTGLSFGVKLPTGDARYAHFDADTEIGTGSTDLLLGGYHQGKIRALAGWSYFLETLWQEPALTRGDYRPGAEVVAVAGLYRSGGSLGAVSLTPVMQASADVRARDGGALGDPANTGYRRLLVAPGIELGLARVRIYAEVGLPVYEEVGGNQLIARRLIKVVFSYSY